MLIILFVFVVFILTGKLLGLYDSRVYLYTKNILLSVDILINTLLFGEPYETISSRAGKGRLRGNKYWTVLADILDLIDPGHITSAIKGTTSSFNSFSKCTCNKGD